jgi:outer membrane beta-barrel protein
MISRLGWIFAACGVFLYSSSLAAQSLEELENELFSGGATSNTSSSVSTESYFESSAKTAPSSDAAPTQAPQRVERSRPVDPRVFQDIDNFVSGPKSIPMDHIFVVKHKYIFKANRHEIIPFAVGFQPGDSFRKQVSMGMSYLYHFTDSFAVEALHVNVLTNLGTGFSDDLFENTKLEVERVEPVLSAGAALHWSPFKGKSATESNIYHFEGYLFLGGGMTQYEVGSSPMIMGGLGARMFLNRRSTLKFELRDYFDFKENAGNRLSIVLGAGILLGTPKL